MNLNNRRLALALALAAAPAIYGVARADGLTRSAEAAETSRGANASLKAELVDADTKAQQGSALVKVSVKGVQIVDPSEKTGQKATVGQGHLQYQIDNGPLISTTAQKLGFSGLKPGEHTITVILAGNDQAPLGPTEGLTFTVPQPKQ